MPVIAVMLVVISIVILTTFYIPSLPVWFWFEAIVGFLRSLSPHPGECLDDRRKTDTGLHFDPRSLVHYVKGLDA